MASSQRAAWLVSTTTRPTAIRSRLPPAFSLKTPSSKQGNHIRLFHSTPHPHDSSFLNLSRLSLTQESRFLSKERGIPRTELAPHLELIRKSEVDPFVGKTDTTLGLPLSGIGSHNANPLAKELEYMKSEKERTQAALRDLGEKYKKRENEATMLVLFTVGLILGILYPVDFRELCEPAVKRWKRAKEKADALTAMMTETSSTPPRGSSSRAGAEMVNLKTSTNGQAPVRRSNWSRMLWAEPH